MEEADTLLAWFLRVVEAGKLSSNDVASLREQVDLAIKNRKHCKKLTALDKQLTDEFKSFTDLSTMDSAFGIRLCARTRYALSSGIYRSWCSFVTHLSRRMEEIGVPFVEDDRVRDSIAELLWEGTAHKTNGWKQSNENVNQEEKVASRIEQLVSTPRVRSAVEDLVSLESHLTVAAAALSSYETRCVADHAGEMRTASIRSWHKKLHVDASKILALHHVFKQRFVVNLLRDGISDGPAMSTRPVDASSCFFSLLAVKPKVMDADDINELGKWLLHYAAKVRVACGCEMSRIGQLLLHKDEPWHECWHDVDLCTDVDVHQQSPWTRLVLQAPAHLADFSNAPEKTRISVGRRNLCTQHCLPTVVLAHVVSTLLRQEKILLSHVGNAYLMRVIACEFVSYEGHLLDLIRTELSPEAARSGVELPRGWTDLEATISLSESNAEHTDQDKSFPLTGVEEMR